MIAANSDSAALTAQADIYRFYVTVIRPALAEFAFTADVVGEETTDLDVFFERARVNTHNALCYEMRRTFALIIAALFERQLRTWLSGKLPTATTKIDKIREWKDLFKRVDQVDGAILTDDLRADLDELRSVANAVRHGSEKSVDEVLKAAPHFWDQARARPDSRWQSDLVGNMRIPDARLERYTRAVLEFWHLAGASSLIPGVGN